jgi:hypothetical protein
LIVEWIGEALKLATITIGSVPNNAKARRRFAGVSVSADICRTHLKRVI